MKMMSLVKSMNANIAPTLRSYFSTSHRSDHFAAVSCRSFSPDHDLAVHVLLQLFGCPTSWSKYSTHKVILARRSYVRVPVSDIDNYYETKHTSAFLKIQNIQNKCYKELYNTNIIKVKNHRS